jgi:TonB family protein
MLSSTLFTRVFISYLLWALLPQVPAQVTTGTYQPRIHITQDELCCITADFVDPVYPREARLAHVEGVVKLDLVIAGDGSIGELQAISGDPLLVDSAMKAVRRWSFTVEGQSLPGIAPPEIEAPISFTFKIVSPPKPAFLHLSNGQVIRADSVREFTDGIEYSVGRRTYHISPDSVTHIDACSRLLLIPTKRGDCALSGGPSFFIIAIPLVPAIKK